MRDDAWVRWVRSWTPLQVASAVAAVSFTAYGLWLLGSAIRLPGWATVAIMIVFFGYLMSVLQVWQVQRRGLADLITALVIVGVAAASGHLLAHLDPGQLVKVIIRALLSVGVVAVLWRTFHDRAKTR